MPSSSFPREWGCPRCMHVRETAPSGGADTCRAQAGAPRTSHQPGQGRSQPGRPCNRKRRNCSLGEESGTASRGGSFASHFPAQHRHRSQPDFKSLDVGAPQVRLGRPDQGLPGGCRARRPQFRRHQVPARGQIPHFEPAAAVIRTPHGAVGPVQSPRKNRPRDQLEPQHRAAVAGHDPAGQPSCRNRGKPDLQSRNLLACRHLDLLRRLRVERSSVEDRYVHRSPGSVGPRSHDGCRGGNQIPARPQSGQLGLAPVIRGHAGTVLNDPRTALREPGATRPHACPAPALPPHSGFCPQSRPVRSVRPGVRALQRPAARESTSASGRLPGPPGTCPAPAPDIRRRALLRSGTNRWLLSQR